MPWTRPVSAEVQRVPFPFCSASKGERRAGPQEPVAYEWWVFTGWPQTP